MELSNGIALLGGTDSVPPETAQTIAEMRLPLTWVALGTSITILITWMIYRWRRDRVKRRLNSPRLLLRDLFHLHSLGWSEQRLLLQSARRQKIGNPARLFLEGDLWRQAIEAESNPARQRRLKALQAKLLGE
jgi:hypothetical protein